MTEKLFLLTLCLPLATVLIVFGMRYYAAVQQARAQGAGGETQRQAAAALHSIDSSLADLKVRVAAIETILKQVE